MLTIRRDGDEATLTVRDRGRGLSPEARAHVFDRFYRTDDSSARDSGGMGLGLAIARAIAEAHGGRLSVRSAQGEGSTFALGLPCEAGRGEQHGLRAAP